MNLNPEVLQVPPSVAHQYLVGGENGFLLIDTGLPSDERPLFKFLAAKGVSLEQIELIVITHADGDHFGCLAGLQERTPQLVSAASEIEAAAIRLGHSSRPLKPRGLRKVFYSLVGPMFLSKPARIDRTLSDGDLLPFLGGLEILDSKGHTPGHISLWSASTRTLFAGDSIRVRGQTLLPSSGANTWNETLAIESFEKQIALKPDRIYAGHGVWERK